MNYKVLVKNFNGQRFTSFRQYNTIEDVARYFRLLHETPYTWKDGLFVERYEIIDELTNQTVALYDYSGGYRKELNGSTEDFPITTSRFDIYKSWLRQESYCSKKWNEKQQSFYLRFIETEEFDPIIKEDEFVEKTWWIQNPSNKIVFRSAPGCSCLQFLTTICCGVRIGLDAIPYLTTVRGYNLSYASTDITFYPDSARDIDKEIFDYMLKEAIIIIK